MKTQEVKVSPTMGMSKAAIRRASREIAKQAAAELTDLHDLQFCHIRNFIEEPYVGTSSSGVNPKGGTTVAYRVPPGGGQVIEIATAICNPKDVYDKVFGKHMAAQNFADGKRIKVRLPSNTKWGQQIQYVFGFFG